jgi:demethylmenaquinone methyltransferase/2-methoxy-6-polyprenyl-1,4-benzoquinol methylase
VSDGILFLKMHKPEKDPLKIQTMFSSIAPRYDLLNTLLSFGRDRFWRQFAVNQLPKKETGLFLDLATGTGDIAIEIAKQYPPDTRVIGMDFSEKMLHLGKEKIRKRGYHNRINLRYGNVTDIPYKENTFDAVIIAFGIRNIPDYLNGIQEMTRVVKEGGKIVILEFTSVQKRFFRTLFRLYLTKILPFIGGIVSGRKSAYRYLSHSVVDFPNPEELKGIMEKAGLKDVVFHGLTFRIVSVHIGTK